MRWVTGGYGVGQEQMKDSVAPGGAGDDARGQEQSQSGARPWRVTLAGPCARFGCATILLAAAALKTYQLWTDPALGVIYGSSWLQAGLATYELLLAVWLLCGIGLHWSRRVALVSFMGFGCYAFFMGVSREASCGCFGPVRVKPWWTFGIDAALVAALLAWKAAREGPCTRRAFSLGGLTMSLVACASILSLVVWRPGSAPSAAASLGDDRLVVLEPDKWVGKSFPLTPYIDMVEGEPLSLGSWVVVFYHHDCPKCQRALLHYGQLAEDLGERDERTRVALIEVPPYGPAAVPPHRLCRLGRLRDAKEWLISTPAEVRVADGRVLAARPEADPSSP